MKPRLASSKKWTEFPEDYVQQIKNVFTQEFASFLGNSKLIVNSKIYPEEITLRVGFIEKGRLRQNNFEVSANYSQQKKNAFEQIDNCIDAAASMMADFFEAQKNNEEFSFSETWEKCDFGQSTVYIQHSTTNSDLESKADELLGMKDDNLVKESFVSDDFASESAEQATDSKPSIFSSKHSKKKTGNSKKHKKG